MGAAATLVNNALSDNFGDSAISDALRGRHAAVHAVRIPELLAQTDLAAFVLRVRMQGALSRLPGSHREAVSWPGFECFALGADGGELGRGGREVAAVVMDGLRSGNNKASCLARLLHALLGLGLIPTEPDGSLINLDTDFREGRWDRDAILWTKPPKIA